MPLSLVFDAHLPPLSGLLPSAAGLKGLTDSLDFENRGMGKIHESSGMKPSERDYMDILLHFEDAQTLSVTR